MGVMKAFSNVVYTEDEAINAVWVLSCASMIFFMQLGFALLECGQVRQKNANSVLIKNLFDACVGCIGWWLFGFAFAFGRVDGGFIGFNKAFFATNDLESFPEDYYLSWVFHFAFAATSATIVAGALAERT